VLYLINYRKINAQEFISGKEAPDIQLMFFTKKKGVSK